MPTDDFIPGGGPDASPSAGEGDRVDGVPVVIGHGEMWAEPWSPEDDVDPPEDAESLDDRLRRLTFAAIDDLTLGESDQVELVVGRFVSIGEPNSVELRRELDADRVATFEVERVVSHSACAPEAQRTVIWYSFGGRHHLPVTAADLGTRWLVALGCHRPPWWSPLPTCSPRSDWRLDGAVLLGTGGVTVDEVAARVPGGAP